MAGNSEPLLQTYWLPENSQEEASAVFFAWFLFAVVTLLIILGAISFG